MLLITCDTAFYAIICMCRTVSQGSTFIVVLVVNYYAVFNFQCFSFYNYVSWSYIYLSLGNRVLGKSCQLFVFWLLYFICLSLWCWGLNVDLFVSVLKFSYLLSTAIKQFYDRFWVRNSKVNVHRLRLKICSTCITQISTQTTYKFGISSAWRHRHLTRNIWKI